MDETGYEYPPEEEIRKLEEFSKTDEWRMALTIALIALQNRSYRMAVLSDDLKIIGDAGKDARRVMVIGGKALLEESTKVIGSMKSGELSVREIIAEMDFNHKEQMRKRSGSSKQAKA